MDWFWLIGTGTWHILASKCSRLSYHIAWPYMYYSYQDVYFQLMPAIARQTQEMPLAFDYIKFKKNYPCTSSQHLDCIYTWILNSVEWFVHCMPRLWIPLSLSHPLGTTANKSCPPPFWEVPFGKKSKWYPCHGAFDRSNNPHLPCEHRSRCRDDGWIPIWRR